MDERSGFVIDRLRKKPLHKRGPTVAMVSVDELAQLSQLVQCGRAICLLV